MDSNPRLGSKTATIIDLLDKLFSDGQIYIDLSRTTDPSNVMICDSRDGVISSNVVSPRSTFFGFK